MRKNKYQHQDSGIPETQITWLILDNGSMIDEPDPSTFYTISRHFAHELHYIKVGPPTKKWHDETQNISTRIVAFQTHNLSGSSWIMAQ
jgi:hypothetical protein